MAGTKRKYYAGFKQEALHGVYWHDNFGYYWSHGCVNLSDAYPIGLRDKIRTMKLFFVRLWSQS